MGGQDLVSPDDCEGEWTEEIGFTYCSVFSDRFKCS